MRSEFGLSLGWEAHRGWGCFHPWLAFWEDPFALFYGPFIYFFVVRLTNGSLTSIDEIPAGLSRDSFRDAVHFERRHELYGEFHRRFDMIRYGTWLETMEEANRSRLDYQKWFPLSAAEIAANAEINQNNPGW